MLRKPMLATRIWSGMKWAALALCLWFVLGLVMVFVNVNWATGIICFGPVLLGSFGFILGFFVGGKSPGQLQERALQSAKRECRASANSLRVVDSRLVHVS